jgi:transposase
MFIRVKTTKNSPRKTVQIVENFRKGNTTTQKTVRYLGVAQDDKELELLLELAKTIKEKMEKEQAQPQLFSPEELDKMKEQSRENKKLEDLNQDDRNFYVDLKRLKEESRVIDGIHEAYGELYKQLELDNLFGVRKKRSGEIFKEVVLARLAAPKSKSAIAEILQRSFGVRLDVNAIYRMMDQIDEKLIDKLQKRLYEQTIKLFGNKLDVVFFDATTLYYESFEEDEFRRNGYSKDLKFNQPQVLLALMTTKEGLPVGYELFSGDTYEGHTLIPCLKKLRENYGVDRVVFVADSGLFNKENLVALEDNGFEYIVGARLKSQTKEITAALLEKSDYNYLSEGLKTKEIEHKYGRLIVSHSEKRAKKDAHDRMKAVNTLLRKLRKNGTVNAKDFLSNYGYKKYVKAEAEGLFILDDEKIVSDANWDGLHGIITNSKAITHQEAFEQYKNLWQIEESFRIQKHDLKMRPIYHYKESRVKAHVAILFTAFALAKHLQYQVKLQYEAMSVAKIRDELLEVQSSIYYYPKNGYRYSVPGKVPFRAEKIYKALNLSKYRTTRIVSA